MPGLSKDIHTDINQRMGHMITKARLYKAPKQSLMAQWLRRVSQGYERIVRDLEVMGLNPGWVELGVHSTSV